MGKQTSTVGGSGQMSLHPSWKAAKSSNLELSIAQALLPVRGARLRKRFWLRIAAFIPLAMAALEIPLLCIGMLLQIVLGGTLGTARHPHHVQVIAAMPAMFGLLFGLIIMGRDLVEGRVLRTLLGVGLFACALCLFSLGGELFH